MSKENTVDYRIIGENIKRLRLSKHMTQERLAEAMNLSASHIKNIESNNARISLNTLVSFAEFFNVTTDFILKNPLKSVDMINKLKSENAADYSEKEMRIAIKILNILKDESI